MSRDPQPLGTVLDDWSGCGLEVALLSDPPALRLLMTGPNCGVAGAVELRSLAAIADIASQLETYLELFRAAEPVRGRARQFRVISDSSSGARIRMRCFAQRIGGQRTMITTLSLRGPRDGDQGSFRCHGEQMVDSLARLVHEGRRRLVERTSSELADILSLGS